MPSPAQQRTEMEEAFRLLSEAESATAKARSILGRVFHGLGVNENAYQQGIADGLAQAKRAVERERPMGAVRTDYVEPYCQADIEFCCASARRRVPCGCIPRDPRWDFYVAVHLDGSSLACRDYWYVTDDPCAIPGAHVIVPAGTRTKDYHVGGRIMYRRNDKPSIPGRPLIKRVVKVCS